MSNNAQQVWSVSDLSRAVKELIEDGFFPLWLNGEIGNITIHSSGHVYFTVKDSHSQISAVYFKGAANARRIGLCEGMEIDLYGTLSTYEPRGNYQIHVRNIRPKGTGLLQQRFEELKQLLQNEGLFDPDKKKELPRLPKTIGLVTSLEGAAIQDFMQILTRRFANVHLRIIPVAVQGKGSAEQITRAIEKFNEQKACDVMVVTRGGGSLEDLWSFNEECVARAIADSTIPVISAVGHEVDFTIADFVADMRVPTPSAAAELVIASRESFENKLNDTRRRLESSLRGLHNHYLQNLRRLQSANLFRSPMSIVEGRQQKLDDLHTRLRHNLQMQVVHRRHILQKLSSRLQNCMTRQIGESRNQLQEARIVMRQSLKQNLRLKKMALTNVSKEISLLSPENVLQRGYAIVTDTNNKTILSSELIESGAELQVRVKDGQFKVTKK